MRRDAMLMINTTIKKLFEQMWNEQQIELVNELFAPHFNVYYSGGSVSSHADFKTMLHNWFVGFPDLHHTIDDHFEQGEHLATRWHGVGTHLGEFNNVPATGKRFHYEGITIFHLDNTNKIHTAWVSNDLLKGRPLTHNLNSSLDLGGGGG